MEVKLEDLMKAKTGLASADVTPDNLPSAEVMTAQVEKVVNDLNPEERAQVDKIKDELDLTDSTAILRFGAPAQQKIAEFSDSVLSQVRTKDSGPVGELLGNLVTQVREFEPEEENKIHPLVHNFPAQSLYAALIFLTRLFHGFVPSPLQIL